MWIGFSPIICRRWRNLSTFKRRGQREVLCPPSGRTMSLIQSLSGVKRTCRFALHKSAFDPKRTSASAFVARPRPHPQVEPSISEARWLQTVFCLIRRFAPPESVIHADQGSSRGRLGAEGTSRTGNRGEYSLIVRAEVHVVAFQKRRPARREHPLNATAGRPT